MALKIKHQAKAEIPAELQSLYVERDGAWCLDVDGAVDRAKLEEFRGNNITLTNELKDLRKSMPPMAVVSTLTGRRGPSVTGSSTPSM